jgi:tetratricopeptide (TPR) repeat protein
LYFETKQLPEALTSLDRAININDSDARGFLERGNVLRGLGDDAQALKSYNRAYELKPSWPFHARSVAWILSTSRDVSVRDGERALEIILPVCNEIDWEIASDDQVAAAALAECGKFAEAIKAQEKALEHAFDDELPDAERRLALLKAGQPIRDDGLPP